MIHGIPYSGIDVGELFNSSEQLPKDHRPAAHILNMVQKSRASEVSVGINLHREQSVRVCSGKRWSLFSRQL